MKIESGGYSFERKKPGAPPINNRPFVEALRDVLRSVFEKTKSVVSNLFWPTVGLAGMGLVAWGGIHGDLARAAVGGFLVVASLPFILGSSRYEQIQH